jgi:DNA-binding transcriptional ArsR family regulator
MMYAYLIERMQKGSRRTPMPHQTLVCQHLAESLSVLAHPLRIRIIEELGMKDSCQVQVLAQKLQIPQPAVSHHLAQLRRNGIVEGKRSGKTVSYSLRRRWLAEWLAEGIRLIEMRTLENGSVREAVDTVKQLWQTSSETKLAS